MSGWHKLDVHRLIIDESVYEIIGFKTPCDPGYLYRVEYDEEPLTDYRGLLLTFADLDEAKQAVADHIEDLKS